MHQSISNFCITNGISGVERMKTIVWHRILFYMAMIFLLFPSLSHAFTPTYVDPSYTATNFHTLNFVTRSIEFDQNGNIYTADVANDFSGTVTILKLDAATNYTGMSTYTTYSTTSCCVTGLHFNGVGNLFVSSSMTGGDSGNIDLIDAGTLTSIPYYSMSDPRPTGLSGDTLGNLYFTGRRSSDPNFGNIYKIDSTGTSMSLLINGFVGKGIAVDNNGNVFAANKVDNSIYMFDAVTLSSTLIATFDTTPGELTFDENGDLYAIGEDATLTKTEIIKLSASAPPSSDIAISTLGGYINNTSVAFDGSNYLAVWAFDDGSNAYIYGRFISTSGTTVGNDFIIKSAAPPEGLYTPRVYYGGGNYLVVWEDYLDGIDADVYGVTVSPAGVVGTEVPISNNLGTNQMRPEIAFDGTNFLVVWEDNRYGTYDIWGRFVTTSGTLSGARFAISSAALDQNRPYVQYEGSQYLVVWNDGRNGNLDIYGQLISTTGATIGGDIAVSTAAGTQDRPGIGFDGTDYFVVWSDYRSGTQAEVYGQKITSAGVLTGDPVIISSTGAADKRTRQVLSNGTDSYLVVWCDCDPMLTNRSVRGQFVTYSGALSGSEIIISPVIADQHWISIAFGNTDYLAVWADNRNSGVDYVFGTLIAGGVSLPIPYFTQVNTANTFGQVESLASFQGNLFAGTRSDQLWKSSDGTSFSDIANPSMYIGNPRSLIEFNNELYLLGYGTLPYDAASVWKSSDGINFTNIISNGFGDANNIDIPSYALFNGKLFVGTRNDGTTGGEVWNTIDGIIWSQTGTDGLGNTNNTRIGELVEFNGYLYAGTRNDIEGAHVFRKYPSQPWEMVVGGNGNSYGGANSASGFGSGTGNPVNERIFASAVFNGYLYFGVKHPDTSTSPARLWRSADGINWYQVGGDGFGNPDNYGIDSMLVYNNKLYVGTMNPNTGAELWSSNDGSTWTLVSGDGFGNPVVNQKIRSMVVHNSSLYLGTGNGGFAPLSAGEIWKYEPSNTPLGTNVSVSPATDVNMIFDNVTTEGTTAVTTSSTGNPPPSGFNLGNSPLYYEITTTATFTGLIDVCFNYNEANYGNENLLKLFHFDGSVWVDITTTGYPDTVNNIICGTTSSLSPFIIAEAIPSTDADLSITNTDLPDPVPTAGQNLTYTITVTNNGPDSASGVTVTEVLDASLTLVSATPSQGDPCTGAGTITCNLGTILNGSSATVTVVATTGLTPGMIGSTASVAGNEPDSNTANNSATVTTNVGDVSRASGISTRGKVETGTNIMVGGFTIVGSESKKVLLRGRGPSMSGAPYNFTGTLSNPTLEIYSGATLFATVDDWQSGATMCNAPAVSCGTPSELQAALADPCQPNVGQTTAPPGCNLEAAMYITLPPGAYTAKLKGVNSEIGKGIVEVYDPDMTTLTNMGGISTRGKVLTGTDIMVGGFIISGGSSSKKGLLRGRGPSMSGAPYNFTGTLTNPTLEIYSGATLFASVDDWQSGASMCNAPAISCGTPAELETALVDPCQPNAGQTTAPPSCNLESAMMITLPPGAYTAKLKGVNDGTGIGIVEVYEIP